MFERVRGWRRAGVDDTGDPPFNSIRPHPVSPVGNPHMTDGLHAKLRTWGIDLERIFANAAEGMMTFLFSNGIANLQPDRTEAIEIEAKDREALLVDWLSELLYRATSAYHAYIGFRVHELTDTKLKATVAAAAAEAVEDIKAVTHHELSVRACDGGREATIVFDT
jgi:SHS2 domain-containing protein